MKLIYHDDKALYRQRHRIENMFGRLKACPREGGGWRRIQTRYNRCAHTFKAGIVFAGIGTSWL